MDKNDTFKLVIATRESDRPPLIKPPYKERVLIVGQATLLLIGVKSSDGGRYSCQLLFQGQDSPVSNVATLEIRGKVWIDIHLKISKIRKLARRFVIVLNSSKSILHDTGNQFAGDNNVIFALGSARQEPAPNRGTFRRSIYLI